MKITLDVDDAVWWRLAELAEASEGRVPEVASKALSAAVVGMTKPRRHGPYRNHLPILDEAKRTEIARLRALNRSLPEIARAIGTNHMTVGATLHDMGITTRRKKS